MALEAMLAAWGLPVIFLAAAVEGDAAAFFAGVLAHRGLFPYEAAALTVAAGAFLCDTTLFFLGRHSRRFAFVRRLLSTGPAERMQAIVHRHRIWLALGFRFLWGVRTVAALSLGAARVPARLVLPLDALAVLAWAHLVVGFGYGLGAAMHRLVGQVPLTHHLLLGAAGAAVLALAAWGLHRLWSRRGGA